MIQYVFKDQPVAIKNAKIADAQRIGEALAAIAADAGGELRPQTVWQRARADKNNPLHAHFEWDVQKAAEAHWTDQARTIIRCVRVLDEETEQTEPAFLSVSARGGVSYRSLGDVKSSTDLQLAVLKSAERDLDAFERRYRDLSEVCDLVRAARSKVRKRREKMETEQEFSSGFGKARRGKAWRGAARQA